MKYEHVLLHPWRLCKGRALTSSCGCHLSLELLHLSFELLFPAVCRRLAGSRQRQHERERERASVSECVRACPSVQEATMAHARARAACVCVCVRVRARVRVRTHAERGAGAHLRKELCCRCFTASGIVWKNGRRPHEVRHFDPTPSRGDNLLLLRIPLRLVDARDELQLELLNVSFERRDTRPRSRSVL